MISKTKSELIEMGIYAFGRYLYSFRFEDNIDWDEIVNWCRFQFGNEQYVRRWGYLIVEPPYHRAKNYLLVGFKKRDEAVLFQLTWMY